MKLYLAIIDKMNYFLKRLLFILLFAALVVLSLQVFFRYVLNSSLSWSTELSTYLVIWIAFIGASVAIRHRRLIKLEVLLFRMSPGQQRVMRTIARLIYIPLYIMLVIFGCEIFRITNIQQATTMPFSMTLPYSIIPISAVIMILNTIAVLLVSSDGDAE